MVGLVRVLVYLRRVARELSRANDLAKARLDLEHPDWARRVRGPAKLRVAGVASVDAWNKRYEDLHPEPPADA